MWPAAFELTDLPALKKNEYEPLRNVERILLLLVKGMSKRELVGLLLKVVKEWVARNRE